ncbi:ferredoxin [Rhodococcus artemisiae]|uniref:Ferredoxin n=1 Tax=Rhodococcus artemisiae TaxID=714159 RepID=A0ABU7LAH6_9NOCA|nr:ferredoxin [Rhodococcus artemisiae]MEE2058546.1 ferredoxin [Rhodococcus artemisiae]
MRVVVDTDRCVGHGLCEAAAPEVFEVGDGGFVTVDDAAAATAAETALRTAVNGCPSAALRFAD